ncbi:alanine--tRNA ligase [Buchnera aphidicola]|uniref:Alanine--tRNA ligase n=1 Tax=Buchnera aphidicola subsp. Schizaphis graminum (strain Sg) TaxID=198804 RepID=SYA_BUCAP|nr:alanine--tRNA ligase [Buchnera aphidicola]Q8K9E7.1 RecName: Full=Alanine--tRNA ligase; AltName: Full=Alanyl-tRNA synthetase; Short=AlaRS [Buchnera aphidicola str. Sg (Schizaphis graminum)]AAM67942.1 alanyl-tRNA synthetase [Buchnera aphidicola str. Sg (Schizaphis graminum)]
MKKTTNEIRQSFLNFFKEKEHVIVPSSSLIPENDSTLLFTNAGMNQFKEYFLGQKKKFYPRVTTVQNCLRTGGKHNDLENVGYTKRHHTFFEMLGNFSFNDYFKKEAITYAWELLTSRKWFNIDKNKLWISVYEDDEETYKIWRDIIRIPCHHIVKIGSKNNSQYDSENFWQMGETGPCGPCTEIFYNYDDSNKSNDFLKDKNESFIEIWNIVFIEFNRISKTKIVPLINKSIDTGMGLERISAVLQNVHSNYKIDIFQKLIQKISNFTEIKDLNNISLKIIADHIRSCAFLIAENILPSNEHRGYVLRRIIRRALRHGHKIGIKNNFFYKLVPSLIEIMGDSAKILRKKEKIIEETLKIEEIQFSQTLDKGLKILNAEIKKSTNKTISGKTAFYLYDTFGFPIDLTSDICSEKNIKIDFKGFNIAKEEQKKRSSIKNKFYKDYNKDIIINDTCIFEGYKKNKTKSLVKYIFIKNESVFLIYKGQTATIFLDKTSFYPESGGQIGDIGELYHKKSRFIVENTKKYGDTIGHYGKLISGKIIVNDSIYSKINHVYRNAIQLNHSATHLLHAALQKVLGKNAIQKGSLVSNTHLRFDFSYSGNINLSQIQNIENIINKKIRSNDLIKIKNLSLEEAKKKKAIALFDYKYQSSVRVVFIKDFSIELCGGTHTKRTGNIGLFKIIEQSSVSSGIKRIEAVTGQQAIDYLHIKDNDMQNISFLLKCQNSKITEKIKKIIIQVEKLEKKTDQLQKRENIYQIKKLSKKINNIKGINLLINTFTNYDQKSMKMIIDQLKKELKISIIIFINKNKNDFTVIIRVTKNLINYITALKIINIFIKKANGKGGGKKEIAEGGGMNIKKLPMILNYIKSWITIQLENIKTKNFNN